MSKKDETEGTLKRSTQPAEQFSKSRRAMLKGSLTAMPAIMTLHSGAALARSSNLVSTTKFHMPDSQGRTLCLDLTSVRPVGGRRSNKYDLGKYAYAHINRFGNKEYFVMQHGRKQRIEIPALCERGQIAYFEDGNGWQQIKLPKGGMVSAAPMTSLAGIAKIDITDI